MLRRYSLAAQPCIRRRVDSQTIIRSTMSAVSTASSLNGYQHARKSKRTFEHTIQKADSFLQSRLQQMLYTSARLIGYRRPTHLARTSRGAFD
jgi:hypothetical protein